jgi:diketogulonate reductase-like aldo/keto reductase
VRLKNQALLKTASKYKKTPAQITLRWDVQHGVVPIPKTVHPDRMKENADIFDFSISREDMEYLDTLHADLHMDWDPGDVK